MKDKYKELINIMKNIRELVDSSKSDIVWMWSGYNTVKELLDDIDMYLKALEINDEAVFSKIVFLFGPTGPLQEIAISNGWSDTYMELSNKLDKLVCY